MVARAAVASFDEAATISSGLATIAALDPEVRAAIDTDEDIDVTLIRWMLSLSPEERLDVLQGFADSVAELTYDSPAAKVQRSA